jgi:hypothetical protein
VWMRTNLKETELVRCSRCSQHDSGHIANVRIFVCHGESCGRRNRSQQRSKWLVGSKSRLSERRTEICVVLDMLDFLTPRMKFSYVSRHNASWKRIDERYSTRVMRSMDWSDIVFTDRHLPQSQILVEKEMLFE